MHLISWITKTEIDFRSQFFAKSMDLTFWLKSFLTPWNLTSLSVCKAVGVEVIVIVVAVLTLSYFSYVEQAFDSFSDQHK